MMDLGSIYRSHPLNARTIADRLTRQGLSLESLTEWHLAIDPDTEVTDQNHAGGVQAVLELATLAGITAQSTIIDLGAGLGGSIRVLAAAFGCQGYAIDNDYGRHADCRQLTTRTRLDDRVQSILRDAGMGAPEIIRNADVLWGQSAWIHLADLDDVIASWRAGLSASSRIALADSCLIGRALTATEQRLVEELSLSWASHLRPLDDWTADLEHAGFSIQHHLDRTPEALTHFRRLIECSSRWPSGMLTAAEAAGWQQAVTAIESGLLQSVGLVAVRRT